MANCDICANDIFRDSWQAAGVQRRAFDAPPPMGPNANQGAVNGASPTIDREQLIQTITDRVIAALKSG
jgi:L-fuculose-phosphate aldolase